MIEGYLLRWIFPISIEQFLYDIYSLNAIYIIYIQFVYIYTNIYIYIYTVYIYIYIIVYIYNIIYK